MRNRERGTTLLEFTLVGIPLIFLLISTVEISRGMWQYHTLAHLPHNARVGTSSLRRAAQLLTLATLFIAHATNTHVSFGQELEILAVLLLTSKGAAGVTGSGFIVLAATLSAVGHVPVAGVALILGIDRFMSEARSLTNLIGNGVATVVIGKWCGQLDEEKLKSVL